MAKNILKIAKEIIPIFIMIGLIPLFPNDIALTSVYILNIALLFYLKKEKRDFEIFAFGFFIMIISETFFVSTGVEKFLRNSFFGIMPLWLPFLWAYSFVVMKRVIKYLDF